MSLKLFKTPPPQVALLPDTQFFVRAIPVPDAQKPEDVAAQVELALESSAPFPLAQMYYGHQWFPGAKHALAYAAYRKRFSTASVGTWPAAAAVLPSFATVFNPAARPATTTLLHTPAGITAVHWSDTSGVPDIVSARSLPEPAEDAPPLTDEQQAAARATLRDELLRAMSGTTHLYEYTLPENLAPARADNALVLSVPPLNASQPAHTVAFTNEQLDTLDVRDKAEIAARKTARRRDLLLWRCFLGCAALLVVCAIIEIALFAGKFWQEKRHELVKGQAPYVAEIEKANALALRIEDLSTKRLLPLEMIDLLRPKLPNSVIFTRVATSSAARGINGIEIQAKTTVASDFNNFRSALAAQTNIQKIEVLNSGIRDGSTTFSLAITFAPGAVKPAEDEPPKPVEQPKSATATAAHAAATAAEGAPAATPSLQDQIQQQMGPPDAPVQPQPAGEQPPPQRPEQAEGEPPANLVQTLDSAASYDVRSGDTGAAIARANGVDMQQLVAANPGVDWRRLKVGQKITIPTGSAQ